MSVWDAIAEVREAWAAEQVRFDALAPIDQARERLGVAVDDAGFGVLTTWQRVTADAIARGLPLDRLLDGTCYRCGRLWHNRYTCPEAPMTTPETP